MKIFLCSTFGNCEYNTYTSTRIGKFFLKNNCQIVPDADAADMIVVTTCGVDQFREDSALDVIHSFIKSHPGKKIVVSGCLSKINPEIAGLPNVTCVPPKELHLLNGLIGADSSIDDIRVNRVNTGYIDPRNTVVRDMFYVAVCEGCANNCSYCAIKKAKGNVTSRPIADILAELTNGFASEQKDFSLLADDCGSYGLDIGSDFSVLLNQILPLVPPGARLHIHYFEPARLLKLFPKIDPAIYPHIAFMHIPVQSASNSILKSMNRHYDIEDVLRVAREIKNINPDIRLCTNVLFAYPGETDDEFKSSFRVKEFFDVVVYYCYSPRDNTRAAEMTNQIPDEVKKARADRIQSEAERDPRIFLAYENLGEIGFGEKPAPKIFVFKNE